MSIQRLINNNTQPITEQSYVDGNPVCTKKIFTVAGSINIAAIILFAK